jgi:hypothetical protein
MNETAGAALWIALVTIGSVLGSLTFACAAPLAAMGAIAGLKMRYGEGLALVVASWLANQLVGFLVLGYPHTAETFGWGAAMGIAAVIGFAAAAMVARVRVPALIAVVGGFAAAFLAYQVALYAATAVLPAGGGFSWEAILIVLRVNVVAFIALLVAYRAAVALRFLPATPPLGTATA